MVQQAFTLDGTDDYVAIPDNSRWTFGNDDFTIELWVNFRSVPERAPFVSHDEGGGNTNKWIFWYDALGHRDPRGPALRLHVNSPSSGPSDPVVYPWSPTAGRWYHVGVTRSGSEYALYVNGTRVITETDAGPIPDADAADAHLGIGQAESFLFDGQLDEVEIYSRALSDAEMQAIHNAGSAGKCKLATVCHMLGTSAQGQLVVPVQALAGHLAHGDMIGSCDQPILSFQIPYPVYGDSTYDESRGWLTRCQTSLSWQVTGSGTIQLEPGSGLTWYQIRSDGTTGPFTYSIPDASAFAWIFGGRTEIEDGESGTVPYEATGGGDGHTQPPWFDGIMTVNYSTAGSGMVRSATYNHSCLPPLLPPSDLVAGWPQVILDNGMFRIWRVGLTWTDNSPSETGFRIERCTGPGCTDFAEIATVGANVQSYSDDTQTASGGLAPPYRYRVRAYTDTGNSGYSNTATPGGGA